MKLNYKTIGSGTPVIILHGLLGSLDNWQTFARKLSTQFNVFTIDLRNHGRSPHSHEHSYEAMVRDLEKFFEENNVEKAHVIGHSMGGKVAMQFALTHPEKVLKLIVVDIAPKKYAGGHDVIFEALSSIDLARVTKREDADLLLSSKIDDVTVRQFLLKNIDRNADGTFSWKMNLPALIRNYEKINAAIESEISAQMPAVLIRGGKSAYVLEEDMQAFEKLFPEAKLVTIAAAGHWVHAEAPDAFFTAVHDFLIN